MSDIYEGHFITPGDKVRSIKALLNLETGRLVTRPGLITVKELNSGIINGYFCGKNKYDERISTHNLKWLLQHRAMGDETIKFLASTERGKTIRDFCLNVAREETESGAVRQDKVPS